MSAISMMKEALVWKRSSCLYYYHTSKNVLLHSFMVDKEKIDVISPIIFIRSKVKKKEAVVLV